MRILHGPVEAAGVAGAFVHGLRARGHDAELVLMSTPPFGMSYDRLVEGYPARALEGLRAPLTHDVLHFHFNVTFCEYIDAAWGRLAGRPTMLMQFHGDDCRRREVTFAQHPERARVFDVGDRDEALVDRRLRLAGRLCHAAVVADRELLANVRPFFRTVYLVPAPVRLDLPVASDPEPLPGGTGPVVFHAPSHPQIKGTEMIARALALAGERVPLRARLRTGIPHDQVLAEVRRADIVIDQMNSVTPGIFALEGMALGKPVMCEYRPEMLGPFDRGSPLIPVSPETLTERLLALCEDQEERAAIGARGPGFVRAVHGAEAVAAALEHVYAHARRRVPGVFSATSAGIEPLAEGPPARADPDATVGRSPTTPTGTGQSSTGVARTSEPSATPGSPVP
jgi:hypothetical protein